MQRQEHTIKKNHTTPMPYHLIFFDTETWPHPWLAGQQLLTFRLGAAIYHRMDRIQDLKMQMFHVEQCAQFLDGFTPQKRTVYCFAHNLYFDFRVLELDVRLPAMGWVLEDVYFANAGIQSFFSFRKGKTRLVFIDTVNYFRASVAEIGERIGYPKMVVDFANVTDKELMTYCERDTEIICRATLEWYKLIQDEDLGTTARTLPGQAMSAYKHRFMFEQIVIHTNEGACELERAGYYGGRVEALRIGETQGPIYKLDINSMYPAIMAKNVFPRELLYYNNTIHKLNPVWDAIKDCMAIARVLIRTDEPCYAKVGDNRLIFPVGEFETVVSTESLLHGLVMGHIQEIRELALYKAAEIFSGYVKYFWRKRAEAQERGDEVYSYLYKLLMNSLYGKFGQCRQKLLYKEDAPAEESAIGTEYFPLEGDELPSWAKPSQVLEIEDGRYLSAVWWIWCSRKFCWTSARDLANDAFPAIAAHVTDYARMQLWRLMDAVGEDNLLYVDTDSLFVTTEGKERVAGEIGSGLGQLKIESVADSVKIFAPKDYQFGEEVKMKGVKSKATYDETTDKWTQTQFEKIRGHLHSGYNAGIVLKDISKHLGRKVENRQVLPGGRTRPLKLSL